jgi:hypothetical protein
MASSYDNLPVIINVPDKKGLIKFNLITYMTSTLIEYDKLLEHCLRDTHSSYRLSGKSYPFSYLLLKQTISSSEKS